MTSFVCGGDSPWFILFRRSLWTLLMGVAVGGLAFTPAVLGQESRKVPVAATPKLVGKPIGSVSLPSLEGKTVDVAAFRGKVVLLNFWASWCGPCRREMPALSQLQSQQGSGFQVVSVNIDRNASDARSFLAKVVATPSYPILLDAKNVVMGRLGVTSMPTSFLIDRSGIIREKIVGYNEEEFAQLSQKIAALGK